MDCGDLKGKKIILFRESLVGAGGAERLLFEEAKYLKKKGAEVFILTFNFNKQALFGGAYKLKIEQIGHPISNVVHLITNILSLRRKIKEINPDIILLSSVLDCVPFYFATLFTPYSYSTHVHGTIFWFLSDISKYAFIYRKVFREIRESVVGHKEFIPIKCPERNPLRRVLKEFIAIFMYKGVRKAKKIFVLSNQMKWEVGKLYGKNAIVLKGAFPREILNYKPKLDIKARLGLKGKRMILSISRLDPRKRIGLLIRAFREVSEHFNDTVLVIGGAGSEEKKLKNLAKQLNLSDKVIFVGFIKEEELWDYLAACDVFAHPAWADFDIAAYEALALHKKVVWSTEMEVDEYLTMNRHIFIANPTVDDFAKALERALTTDVAEINDLSVYTWDNYCQAIMKELIGS